MGGPEKGLAYSGEQTAAQYQRAALNSYRDAVPPPPGFAGVLNTHMQLLEKLEQQVASLAQQLAPLCLPDGPSPGGASTAKSPRSPLSDALDASNDRLASLSYQLVSLQSRLDL